MTDIYLPELMELDAYWENAIKDAAENTVYNTKRLEFALHNRKKINKILESSCYKPVIMEMMRNRKRYNNKSMDGSTDEDDDEMTESSCNDDLEPESSIESMNEAEEDENRKSGPSAKRKVKSTPATRNLYKDMNGTCFRDKGGRKIKKSNVEFVQDPLNEDHTDRKKCCSSRAYSKINPCILRKRKLAMITAELKRKNRDANVKRQNKRAKNMKMKNKTYKTKRPKRKIGRGSKNHSRCVEKQDPKSTNQETKADNTNAKEPNNNVNNEDIKKNSVPGKETPVTKKVSQNINKGTGNPTNPPKPEKGQAKGKCSLNPIPKESVIRYGSISDSGQSFKSESLSSFGD